MNNSISLLQSQQNISKWISDNDDGNLEIDYLPWASDQPNGFSSQKCMSFDSVRYGYHDEECTSKMCIPCQLPKYIFFHLRGLPLNLQEQDLLDVDYIVSIEPGRVSFEGFSGLSSIILDPFSQNWKIISLGKVIGSYNGTKIYPIGLSTWDLFLERNVTLDLKLAQVSKK